MPATEARMSHLVRLDVKRGTSYVQVLRLEFDAEMQARVGNAFGIISAETKGRKGEALAANLEDAFVRGIAEAILKLPADAPQDQIFETAMSRTNHALNRLFGEYGLDVDPEHVSATVVAIKDHDVVAATWGCPTVLLFHPLPNDGAKTFDLVDDSRAETSPFKTANVRRCFGNIIAGRMGKHDRLLVASQDLRMFLGDDALCNVVLERSPAEATDELGKLLSPRADAMTIALVILDVAEIRYIEHELAKTTDVATLPPSSRTNASIAQLLKTQSDTGATLTPSLIAGIGKKVGDLLRRESSSAPKAPPEKAKTGRQRTETTGAEKISAYATEKRDASDVDRTAAGMIIVGLIASGKGLLAALRASASFIWAMRGQETRAARLRMTQEKIDGFFNGLVDRYNGFSAPSRALFFTALTLIMIARAGIAVASAEQAKAAAAVAYDRATSSIQQQIDSAESSMTYRDDARAKDLLTQASAAVAALPNRTQDQRTTRDSLDKKIAAANEDLRQEVTLGQPEIVASISTGAGAANLERVIFAGGDLWSVADTGEIYQISTTDGSAKKVADAPGRMMPAIFLAQGSGVFAASPSGASVTITPAGKTAQGTIDFQDAQTTPTDAEFYNSSLYVLDAQHDRITRNMASGPGFGKSQFYLKDGTDVSTAVSLSIDSAIYVLRKDGTVSRIVRGLQTPFGVGPVDPPMTAPLRLQTTADADLYVLDSSPARIVRFDKKTGTLVAQYVNDALKGATDFTIDDTGANAYVTKGNQILKFALPDAKP